MQDLTDEERVDRASGRQLISRSALARSRSLSLFSCSDDGGGSGGGDGS